MFLYEVLSTLLFIILLPIYYIIRVFNGKFLYGWKEKLGYFKNPHLGNKVIMFHGVSVGEIIALENLIKVTKKTFPDYKIVVTTGTKTGQEIAKKKYIDLADYITYFPFDIPSCVEKFLTKIRPKIVLIAETEIWPIFAAYCKRKNISLLTINGRMSDSTYNLYSLFKPFFRKILNKYTAILTQSEEDMEKLISIGAPKNITRVMKNLKFDVKKSDGTADIGQSDFRVIIAGSTHKGEDEIIINIFKKLKNEFPDIKLLEVPRHTTRVMNVKSFSQKANLSTGLRSKGDTFKEKDVIILDTMGELSKMYSMCYFAFIGGSFCNTGGHNPLEAVVYSKPVISGPDIHNFKDIYGILCKSNAGKIVKNKQELEDYMRKLLSNNKFYQKACQDCDDVFKNQEGALNAVIDTLKTLI